MQNQERLNYLAEKMKLKLQNPCSNCGSKNLDVTGETVLTVQNNLPNIDIGGVGIPVVMITCTKCGLVNTYAHKLAGIDL